MPVQQVWAWQDLVRALARWSKGIVSGSIHRRTSAGAKRLITMLRAEDAANLEIMARQKQIAEDEPEAEIARIGSRRISRKHQHQRPVRIAVDKSRIMLIRLERCLDPIFLCAGVRDHVWVRVRGSSRVTRHPLRNGRLYIVRVGFNRRTKYVKIYTGVVTLSESRFHHQQHVPESFAAMIITSL